jgi:short-subunit dehydrogenase
MDKKKVVLITGASSGMGRNTALFLSNNDFIVYATSRNIDRLDDIKNKNLIPIQLDITNHLEVKKIINKIYEEQKQIDILINNAGYGLLSSVENATEEQMLEQFNINVFGLLRVSKYVIPIMRKQNSGVIINISSFLGKIGLPLFTFYNASKYAVEGITDSLRYELKDYNIRVHSVLPGFFNTNFARDNLKINQETISSNSPYNKLVSTLSPQILDQINNGNSTKDVAKLILDIINDDKFQARQTVGDKAKKFIPMKKELSDEDFERRVSDYYGI